MSRAKISQLRADQSSANSYEEWLAASLELDSLLDLDKWKIEDDDPQLYDAKKVRYALNELRSARKAKDMRRLLYLIRTSFSRNVGNMGNPLLYLESYSGTKRLIETYISECEQAIEAVMNSEAVDDHELMNTLIQTRKAYGRTALVLSGGSILGFLHSGVLYELSRANLLPRIISGSSAGAIFASIICSRRDDQLDEVWELRHTPLEIFETTDKPESLIMHLRRFLTDGTWLDSSHIVELSKALLGEDLTFQEAYNRTGRILNVTVSDAGLYEMPKLLNYLTAPNVLIWSAVCASCSVPLIFASNVLMAKNPKTKEIYPWSKAAFIDGSVDNDLPLTRLAEMFNVNHFIACQVNPHISPLIRISERVAGNSASAIAAPVYYMGQSTGLDPGYNFRPHEAHQHLYQRPRLITRWLQACQHLVLGEISHALVVANRLGVMPRATSGLLKVMAQDYVGNVTILPEIGWTDFARLFKNPSAEWQEQAWKRGRLAVWPKLALVRNHCAIELALDRAIVTLRIRLIGVGVNHSSRGNGALHSSTSALALSSYTKHRRRHSEDSLNMLRTARHLSIGEIDTTPRPSLVGLRRMPSSVTLPDLSQQRFASRQNSVPGSSTSTPYNGTPINTSAKLFSGAYANNASNGTNGSNGNGSHNNIASNGNGSNGNNIYGNGANAASDSSIGHASGAASSESVKTFTLGQSPSMSRVNSHTNLNRRH